MANCGNKFNQDRIPIQYFKFSQNLPCFYFILLLCDCECKRSRECRANANARPCYRHPSVCLSVCLSVRMSNACIVIERKKLLSTFLHHVKDRLS